MIPASNPVFYIMGLPNGNGWGSRLAEGNLSVERRAGVEFGIRKHRRHIQPVVIAGLDPSPIGTKRNPSSHLTAPPDFANG